LQTGLSELKALSSFIQKDKQFAIVNC